MQVYLRLPAKCTSKTRFPISGGIGDSFKFLYQEIVTRMLRHFCGSNNSKPWSSVPTRSHEKTLFYKIAISHEIACVGFSSSNFRKSM